MLYGRRHLGQSKPHPESTLIQSLLKRHTPFIRPTYKTFQAKYIMLLVMSLLGASAVVMSVAYYFIHQNYKIFEAIALDGHRNLLFHLDKEVSWLAFFMVFSVLLISGIGLWIGLKMTNAMIKPLWSIEQHMREISQGQWQEDSFAPQLFDELSSFSKNYSHFYQTLRADAEWELQQLEKMSVDSKDWNSWKNWQNLIERKRALLGKPVNPESAASPVAVEPVRRAS